MNFNIYEHLETFNIYTYLEQYFTKISSIEIKLHKEIDDDNFRLYMSFYTLYIYDKSDIDINTYNNPYFNPSSINSKRININNLNNTYNTIIYNYVINKTFAEMENEHLVHIKRSNKFRNFDNYSNNKFVYIIEKQNGIYFLNCYTHNTEYAKIFDTKYIQKDVYNKKRIITIMEDAYAENKKIVYNNLLDIIENNIAYTNCSNINLFNTLLKSDIKLFNYQKNDIAWMFDIENRVLQNNNKITFKKKYINIYEINNKKYIILEINNCNKYSKYVQEINDSLDIQLDINDECIFYGGNIISEVGLGKTLISLYFILENCVNNKNRQIYINLINNFNDVCNYSYKRGVNKGMNCQKKINDGLYCKEHSKSVFSEKTNLTYNLKNIEMFDFSKFIINSLICNNSTLIFCPSQLCDQWVSEYYDKFDNTTNFRIIMIATKDQYINLTIGDILFSDIVIVSYKFLTNKFYTNFSYDNASHLSIDDKYKFLNSKNFNLKCFKWERIILDEAHEIRNMVDNQKILNTIYNLKSVYKWNITGTPFSNKLDSFKSLQSYNTNIKIENDIVNEDYINSCMILFRKNTKESIKNEYVKTLITEYNKILTFTKEEEVIYNSYIEENGNYNNIPFLIRLCCHPELTYKTRKLIENCKTFEEIQKVILKSNMDTMKELLIKKNNILDKIQNIKIKIENSNNNYMIENWKQEIGGYRRSLTATEKEYTNTERIYNYLKNAVESLKTNDICPICLDDLVDANITKCGHKFCWDCISLVFKNKYNSTFQCPSCKEPLNTGDIYKYKSTKDQQNNVTYCELDLLIKKIKSTKIGNIIYFINTEIKPDDKVILFSQWDELLHKVGNILEEYNINITYCKGSVYNRTKSIKKFTDQSGNCNIILLSSCNSASGINLTIANKIILLEPIYGDKEYRQNIESQAIGRCYRIGQKRLIEVYRFIIGNTIEEDIINDHNINIKQMMLNA